LGGVGEDFLNYLMGALVVGREYSVGGGMGWGLGGLGVGWIKHGGSLGMGWWKRVVEGREGVSVVVEDCLKRLLIEMLLCSS
jgi:hypothetical protein